MFGKLLNGEEEGWGMILDLWSDNGNAYQDREVEMKGRDKGRRRDVDVRVRYRSL